MKPPPSVSATDYLAAERTFLAWIRTGLALMGFGFVVARFGFFLQALESGQSNLPVRAYGPSFWFGTGLIVLGVLVNVVSAWIHVRLVKELNSGERAFDRPSRLAVIVAVTLAAFGLAMAAYLVSVREPRQANLERGSAMISGGKDGIRTLAAHASVDQTVQKLQEFLRAKGVKLFVTVDHDGEAAAAGIGMPPTKLVIFGNPKAGTPLMLASPSIAIDLPLKILVWEDTGGQVWLSYNDPAYLAARHGLPAELTENIRVVEAIAVAAAS